MILLMILSSTLGFFFFGFNLGIFNIVQRVIAFYNGWSSTEQSLYIGIITAAMPLGAIFGALTSGLVQNSIKSVRLSFIINSCVSLIGTSILAVDYSIYSLTIGRVISGYGVGFFGSIVSTYIKDALPLQFIPPSLALNQIMLTIGTFLSYVMAFLLPQAYQDL